MIFRYLPTLQNAQQHHCYARLSSTIDVRNGNVPLYPSVSHSLVPLCSLSISTLLKHNLFIYLIYYPSKFVFRVAFPLPQLTLKLIRMKSVGIIERNIFFRGFCSVFSLDVTPEFRIFSGAAPDTMRPSNNRYYQQK